MNRSAHRIRFWPFASRLVRKLLEPGALAAMRRVLRSSPDDIYSLGALLEDAASSWPEHTALIFDGERWTWAEFNAWVNQVAGVLAARGLQPGEVLAIGMHNRPELLVCVAAAAKLGAVAALLNTAQRGPVLAHSLGLVGPRMLVVDADMAEATAALDPQPVGLLDRFAVGEGVASGTGAYAPLDQLSRDQPADNPASTGAVQLRDPCFYIFTSGTTGLPKASVMTHHRWFRSALGTARVSLGLQPDDVFYCCLPFYHNTALTLVFGSVVASGAALALGRSFSASRFWDEIAASQATAFAYVGELPRYLLNRPADPRERQPQLRLMFGNGLRPELWAPTKARFGVEHICEFYGSSEGTNGFVNLFNFDQSCGWAAFGWAIVAWDAEHECAERDAQGFLRRLGPGQTGLLLTEVSDTLPFDGYTDAEASQRKLLRNVFKPGDCWFNTGDLMQHQGWGYVRFIDRTGDTWRWRGENVAATEVEAVAAAFGGVADAVAYGVEVAGSEGRCGMLSLTLKESATLDLPGLARHLRVTLPAYAVPRFLRLRPQQTLTGTFKHQKTALKREGYDPSAAGADPLYLLPTDADNWQSVDESLLSRIHGGQVAL